MRQRRLKRKRRRRPKPKKIPSSPKRSVLLRSRQPMERPKPQKTSRRTHRPNKKSSNCWTTLTMNRSRQSRKLHRAKPVFENRQWPQNHLSSSEISTTPSTRIQRMNLNKLTNRIVRSSKDAHFLSFMKEPGSSRENSLKKFLSGSFTI